MAQQINLYTPTLLAPLRYFSAHTMLAALAVMAAGLLTMGLWLSAQSRQARADRQDTLARQAQERRQLTEARHRHRQQTDPAALEHELAEAQRQLAQLRLRVQGLERGQLPAGQSHGPLLQLLARTTPPQSWITELRAGPQRVQLIGATLEPAELAGWIRGLQEHPALDGHRFDDVRVERLGQEQMLQQSGLGPREDAPLRPVTAGAQAWGFRISAEPRAIGVQP